MPEKRKPTQAFIDAALRAFLENTQDMVFIKDCELVYCGASPSFAAIVGCSDPADVIGKTDQELFKDPDLVRRYTEDDRTLFASGKPLLRYTEPLPMKDGQLRYGSTSKYLIHGEDGRPVGMYGVSRDVTTQHLAQLNYESEVDYLLGLPSGVFAVAAFDVSAWRVLEVRTQEGYDAFFPESESVEDFLSHAADQIVGNESFAEHVRELSQEQLTVRRRSSDRERTFEYRRRFPDGAVRWTRNESKYLVNPTDGHLTVFFLLRDIEEEKLRHTALLRAAESDAMTGLLHHEATLRHISEYLAGSGRTGMHALFMIDIDNFKSINDTFGHQTGDEVIADVASVLRRCFRSSDVIGRVGGDEFLALMKQTTPRAARKKAQELIEALQYVCTRPATSVELSGSVGVALYRGNSESTDALYAEADAALYQAKAAGKNRFYFADGSTEADVSTPAPDAASAIHLRTLLESIDGAVLLLEQADDDFRMVYASRDVFRMLGVPGEFGITLAGQLLHAVTAEDRAALREALFSCAASGAPIDCTCRVRSGSAQRWYHLRGSRLPKSADSVPRILAVISDVTAIKQGGEQLAFAELRYRTAMEQSGILMCEVDLLSDTVRFSGTFAEQIGCAGTAFPHPPDTARAAAFLRADSLPGYARMFDDLRRGNDRETYTCVALGRDGSEFPLQGHFHLLHDADGAPYYAIGVALPLLNERELLLYRTMSHGGVFSIRMDRDLTLLYGNDRYYAIHGYTPAAMREALHNRCARAVHPEDLPALRKAFSDAAAEKKPRLTCVTRIVTGTGAQKYVRISGEFAAQESGGRTFSGVILDVTEQKLGELALERQKLLDEAQYRRTLALREKTDTSAIVSAYLDLTQNACQELHVFLEALPKRFSAPKHITVDGLFAFLAHRHADGAQRKEFSHLFRREALIAGFLAGSPSLSFEHCLFDRPKHAVWVRTDLVMAQNPDTGDVEAFLSIHSIDAERVARAVAERIMHEEFESVFLIDTESGAMTVLYVRDGELSPPATGDDYAAHIAQAFPKILTDDVEAALGAFALPEVRAHLDQSGGYAVSFCVRARSGGSIRNKWQFCYLDDLRRTILCRSSDVTELYAAELDVLTGLYSREAFYRHVRSRLDEYPGERFVIVRADLDRFKAYNDIFGSATGDRLLSDVGRVLRENIVGERVFGRIEADHFAALLPADGISVQGFFEFAKNWLGSYRKDFHLTASIGVFEITDPSLDVSLMCDRALLALRSVKGSYATKIGYYDESLRSRLLEEQALIGDVDKALSSGQFCLYFQPQINYEDGSLIGAEALVRWRHPTRGLLMPDSFIPLFEHNGFISRLDEYVWDKACAYMRTWKDKGGKLLPVSVAVNISRLDIYDLNLCDKLEALVRRYDLPPSSLRLEITESAYMENPQQLISVVGSLQSAGFAVEMDDFGAGYSSLNTLKDVPVDLLKLDVRFLSSGDNDPRGGSILSSVLRMAHWLKLPVIAEGVETAAQAAYLKSLNCFYMQGYYFGRPMPAEDFETLLAQKDVSRMDRYAQVDVAGMAAFWETSAQTALLFNEFIGSAAILEYQNGFAEIVRANDSFFTELGMTRRTFTDSATPLLDGFSEAPRAAFLAMLETARSTGTTAECELSGAPLPGCAHRIWRCRARELARNNESCLFFLTLENITQLRALEAAVRGK